MSGPMERAIERAEIETDAADAQREEDLVMASLWEKHDEELADNMRDPHLITETREVVVNQELLDDAEEDDEL